MPKLRSKKQSPEIPDDFVAGRRASCQIERDDGFVDSIYDLCKSKSDSLIGIILAHLEQFENDWADGYSDLNAGWAIKHTQGERARKYKVHHVRLGPGHRYRMFLTLIPGQMRVVLLEVVLKDSTEQDRVIDRVVEKARKHWRAYL